LCSGWQDFAAFARARDIAEKRREAFELPYAIDGDRVGGLTIKLIFNKLDRWSKALKYMVADLKWALKCEQLLFPNVICC
jgi:beclin